MSDLRDFMAGRAARANPPPIAESLRRVLRPPRDAERVAAVLDVIRRFDRPQRTIGAPPAVELAAGQADVIRRFDRQRRAGRDLEEALVLDGLLPESWSTPVRWATRYGEPVRATVAHVAALAAFAPALALALPLVEEYRLAAQEWFGRPVGEGVWLDLLRPMDVTALALHLPLLDWTFLFGDCPGEAPAPLVAVAAHNAGLNSASNVPGPAERAAAERGLRWCEAQALKALFDSEALARAGAAGMCVPEGECSGYYPGCAFSGMPFWGLPDPGRPLWESWLTGFGVLRVYPDRPGPGVVLGMPPLEALAADSPELSPQGR
jgi:hypothetical protein